MNMIRKTLISATLSAALASSAGLPFGADSSEPIKIGTHNWSSQVVMAYVIGGILKNLVTQLNMYLRTPKRHMKLHEMAI